MRFQIAICCSRKFFPGIKKLLPDHPDIEVIYLENIKFCMDFLSENTPNILIFEAESKIERLENLIFSLSESGKLTEMAAVTESGSLKHAIALIKAGVREYWVLPEDSIKVRSWVDNIFQNWLEKREGIKLRKMRRDKYDFSKIIGESKKLKKVIHTAGRVMDRKNITILITGETGTGKELLARVIHYNAAGPDQPFVEISCTAIPDNLLEAELFGYEKGAFTDARERKRGLMEIAHGGTIFLDEIGELGIGLQSKLLQVIEQKTFRRLGGLKLITVDLRIIAATNVELEEAVKQKKFRKDLYYRLKVIPLELPPLRERGDDIFLLTNHFIDEFNREHGKSVRGISNEVKELFRKHQWEGNVRELKYAIEKAVILSDKEILEPEDFELTLPVAESVEETEGLKALLRRGKKETESENLYFSIPFNSASLNNVEKEIIFKVLDYTGWNKSKAARILGVSRPRLDRLINKFS